MSVPNYHMGALKNTSKREMASRFPGVYSYTIVRQGWVCRYVSDEPSTANAEAWLQRILSMENHPDSWCVIHRIDDESVFFVWVLNGVVQKAVSCGPTEIDSIVIQRCGGVYLTNNQDQVYLPEGQYQQIVEPLSEKELVPFALTKKAGKAWLIPVAVIGLSVIGGALHQQMQPPPEPVMVDPYLVYKQSVSNAIAAEPVLLNAASLGAYAALLPEGWLLVDIKLMNRQLILHAKREPLGERSIIEAWLNANPALKKYAVVSWKGINVTVPMTQTLTDWQNKITPVMPLTDSFKDRLIAMGWEVAEASSLPGVTSQTLSFKASKTNAVLADLQSIANWMETLPMGVTELEMKPSSLGRYTTSLTLTVIGAPS
ncbi:hypothetical protein [Photobacterium leiognathi]|uniref:hypothetical protein n=1 Tax=Photobacterium leiognathi TaxID=553611 RepID=UPI00273892F7|nr:hypothetical protein [Photobacterium leiognathi]